jgi:hypothetical protein
LGKARASSENEGLGVVLPCRGSSFFFFFGGGGGRRERRSGAARGRRRGRR